MGKLGPAIISISIPDDKTLHKKLVKELLGSSQELLSEFVRLFLLQINQSSLR